MTFLQYNFNEKIENIGIMIPLLASHFQGNMLFFNNAYGRGRIWCLEPFKFEFSNPEPV